MRASGKPRVNLAEFRSDPAEYPLKTASELIQITCPQAKNYGLPLIPGYVDSRPDDTDDYPFQLVTPHSKFRANSSGYANPWLQRLEPHSVWINPEDAEARGISQGDMVEVSSQSGKLTIPAKVTQRIMPGVVCIYQGVWYKPSEGGIDEGGCANVLTSHRVSPTGVEWRFTRNGFRCGGGRHEKSEFCN